MQLIEPHFCASLGQFINMFRHQRLKRLADFHAVKTESTHAPHRVAKSLGRDLECHETPI